MVSFRARLRSASSRSTPSAPSGWEATAERERHTPDCFPSLHFWCMEHLSGANSILLRGALCAGEEQPDGLLPGAVLLNDDNHDDNHSSRWSIVEVWDVLYDGDAAWSCLDWRWSAASPFL